MGVGTRPGVFFVDLVRRVIVKHELQEKREECGGRWGMKDGSEVVDELGGELDD